MFPLRQTGVKAGSSSWLRSRGYLLAAITALGTIGILLLRPKPMGVVPVERRDVVAEVQGTGTIGVDVLANVGSRVNGRVKKVLADDGDSVRRGQVLATIDDDDLRHQMQNARAQLNAAQAAQWQTRRTWLRDKTLAEQGVISADAADQSRRQWLVDSGQVRAAAEDLGYREYLLSEATVPSLIDGVVIKRWVEPGDAVVQGQTLFTVADPRLTWVAAYVDQRFAGQIRAGEPATVVVRGRDDHPFRGYVYRIEPQADPQAEEMTVDVTFPLPPAELEIGQWADVYIQAGDAKDALAVPQSSVVTTGDRQSVFVVAGGRALQVAVRTIASSPRGAIVGVTGNIKAGELVVSNPTGIRPGERVRAASANPATQIPETNR